jgi:alkane 1-monooxygenase
MIFHYLKFTLFYLLSILTVIAILLGSDWIWITYLVSSVFIIFGDTYFGDDLSIPDYKQSGPLTVQLWLALPLLTLLMFVSIWSVSPSDTFGFGVWLNTIVDYDFVEAKQNTVLWQHAIAVFYVGLMIAMMGTVTAHELVHRTWDRTSMIIGRWLLAFSFDSNFSIEHVYGHHLNVATTNDPATAPRGRNVYQHIVKSTVEGNLSAWRIEAKRLKRRKMPIYSIRNTFIRGLLMSLTLLIFTFLIADWAGLTFFILAGCWGKALLEITNYMEHYGLVRNNKSPVAPRHSWNTNKKITSWSMFNLSRHSHHHAQGHVPFHKLKPYPEAPMMLNGYLATLSVTLIPPLWFKLMQPKLEEWDEQFATDEEKLLLEQPS